LVIINGSKVNGSRMDQLHCILRFSPVRACAPEVVFVEKGPKEVPNAFVIFDTFKAKEVVIHIMLSAGILLPF
jgi:hypothetical protein